MTLRAALVHGGAAGGVRSTLRLEGAAVLVASVALFHAAGGRWSVFALLFLLPDLSFAAYLLGPRIATVSYNTAHSYVLPIALLLLSHWRTPLLPYALVWFAHIGFDRTLGYGLKYASAFDRTHLGPIGRARASGSGSAGDHDL